MPRVLIGYDIHQARRRRQALQTLRALTACYQRSFFDCPLQPGELEPLLHTLGEQLNTDEDSLVLAFPDPAQAMALTPRWVEGGDGLLLIR